MTTKGLSEGNVMEVVDCVPTCFEECTHEIGPPKRGKNIDERFIRTSSDVRFRDEHGNTLGQSVIAPNVESVANEVGFVVKFAPLEQTGLERIMLEGNEREITDAAMRFQVIEKAAHPGSSPFRIRPDFNVFVYALEDRAS